VCKRKRKNETKIMSSKKREKDGDNTVKKTVFSKIFDEIYFTETGYQKEFCNDPINDYTYLLKINSSLLFENFSVKEQIKYGFIQDTTY
jgi:hypothetical protein